MQQETQKPFGASAFSSMMHGVLLPVSPGNCPLSLRALPVPLVHSPSGTFPRLCKSSSTPILARCFSSGSHRICHDQKRARGRPAERRATRGTVVHQLGTRACGGPSYITVTSPREQRSTFPTRVQGSFSLSCPSCSVSPKEERTLRLMYVGQSLTFSSTALSCEVNDAWCPRW